MFVGGFPYEKWFLLFQESFKSDIDKTLSV